MHFVDVGPTINFNISRITRVDQDIVTKNLFVQTAWLILERQVSQSALVSEM